MSKFDFNIFYGGYDSLAVSKERYTREEAIEIAKRELELPNRKTPYYLCVGDAFVRHRVGTNEDNERCVGWWIEYKEYTRSCPCYVFHIEFREDDGSQNDYEYIKIEPKVK